jgi:hypothetical protein
MSGSLLPLLLLLLLAALLPGVLLALGMRLALAAAAYAAAAAVAESPILPPVDADLPYVAAAACCSVFGCMPLWLAALLLGGRIPANSKVYIR